MTTEEKQLLLKDLCARLPYGVKGLTSGTKTCTLFIIASDGMFQADTFVGYISANEFKPYLRPMSSMTEEEKKSYNELSNDVKNYFGINAESQACSNLVNWLNKNYFDYRGLIPMGLALEAPEGMYKINSL